MSTRLRQIFAATEPSDVEAADRRRQLAEAMQVKALQSPQGDPRFYTAGTALADLGSALVAAYNVKNANKAYQRAKDAKAQQTSEALKRYQASVPDDQVGAEALKRINEAPADELPEPVEKRSAAYGGLVDTLDQGAKDQLVQAILAQQMTPRQQSLVKVGAGESLVDPTTGQSVYAQPAAPSKPLDPLGQLEADRRAGLINDSDYNARKKLLTTREPPAALLVGWHDMTPAEVSAAGLPAGTAAQRNSQTGEINVITKRDNTGALNQKDATAAKQKLNTVKLARQQLNAIKEAFNEGRTGGLNAFGPGQGMLPTQQGKKFDARVDQMRSTLTALTRTPGVGSMSDYESKLDQSKFPSRSDYESVTADKLQQLDDMLSLIEGGYTDLLGTGTQAPEVPQAPAAPPAPGQPTQPPTRDQIARARQYLPQR